MSTFRRSLTILKRSYDFHYYRPKSKYIKAKLAYEGSVRAEDTPNVDTPRAEVATSSPGADVANPGADVGSPGASAASRSATTPPSPPIFGDIEAQFGRFVAFGMLLFENTKFCVCFVQVLRKPSSYSWILGASISIVLEILKRSGLWNQGQIAIGLPSWGKTTALKVAYFRAASGVGFMAPALLLCLGVVRGGFLQRWDAIIFLDVSKVMPILIASQIVTELVQDVLVNQLQAKLSLSKFVPVDHLEPEHPLRDFTARDFTLESYAGVFLGGATAVLWILIIFLGPGFAFGAQPRFLTSVPDRWLVSNASAWSSGLVGANETVP